MNPQSRPIMSPDAALFLPSPYFDNDPIGPKIYFFKNNSFACWDVNEEKLCEGYPKSVRASWPGLQEASPDTKLRAALHVPAWGSFVFFLFENQKELAVWDLQQHRLLDDRLNIDMVLPGGFTDGDFTAVYCELSDRTPVIYAFKGHDYLKWSVGSQWPAQLEAGYPHKTAADWKDGLVLAPRTAVYLEWTTRSNAHSNRKIYYFMGDLYLRWDVPSNTRNYRLDIVAGWKGWPQFD